MCELFPIVQSFLESCQSLCLHEERFSTTNLKLHVALHEQHVNCAKLIDVSVFLKLLSHFRSDLGYGHIEGVHLLYLGTLCVLCQS